MLRHRSWLRSSVVTSKRLLNLQEYQSKRLLDKHGCTVQNFFVVDSAASVSSQFKNFGYEEYAVKAQILAGGRGKGRFVGGPNNLGGVFITKSKNLAAEACNSMIGKFLVTKQTPSAGVLVNKVMVADSVQITRETYLAILLDRESSSPVIIGSRKGGMDIEEVAEKCPEEIVKVVIDIEKGATKAQCLQVAEALDFKGEMAHKAAAEISRLYELFIAVDATQVEINPLAETSDRKVFCIDAKLNFDDNAEFRQKEIFNQAEDTEDCDPREVRAKQCNLNFVGLDGNIACLVNGAGLAMATMDIIKLVGGEPANFLDVGGTVTEEQVFEAFRIITSTPDVQAVLVNIFGGIVNCQTIASGLIAAVKKAGLNVPLVVRLEGTNANEARQMLKNSGLPIHSASDLEDSARQAVDLARASTEKKHKAAA